MEPERDLEARVTALEQAFPSVVADAAAARHLAAGMDREYSDLSLRLEATRAAVNGLGVQVNERLTQVDTRLDGIDTRLDGIDTRLDGIDTRLDGIDTRLDGIDTRLDGHDVRLAGLEQQVGSGFAEVRGRLDAAAAGQQTIVDLLTRLIDDGPA